MNYDFKAAREHAEHLKLEYRRLKWKLPEDGTWSWWLKRQIEEIEQEIAEAHASQNARMTTVSGSGHPVMNIDNIVVPIVPHWDAGRKEEMQWSI